MDRKRSRNCFYPDRPTTVKQKLLIGLNSLNRSRNPACRLRSLLARAPYAKLPWILSHTAQSKVRRSLRPEERPLSLKKLADYLGLAPATVSLVLNRSPVADTISAETKKLVFAGARKFDYQPKTFLPVACGLGAASPFGSWCRRSVKVLMQRSWAELRTT